MANGIELTQSYTTNKKKTDKSFKATQKSGCFRKKKVFKRKKNEI